MRANRGSSEFVWSHIVLYGIPNTVKKLTPESCPATAAREGTEAPLDRMAPGQCGVITRVDGDDDDMARLKAMGVCSGHSVAVIQHGDPLVIKVIGTRIGISARLAAKVVVNQDPHTSCPMLGPEAEGSET